MFARQRLYAHGSGRPETSGSFSAKQQQQQLHDLCLQGAVVLCPFQLQAYVHKMTT